MTDKNKKLNEEDVNRAIAAAYRDGPFISFLINFIRIMADPEMRKIYKSYRPKARIIRRLKQEKCPDYVTDAVTRKARPMLAGFFSRLDYQKFAFTAVTVVLLVIMIIFNPLKNGNNKGHMSWQISMGDSDTKANTNTAITEKDNKDEQAAGVTENEEQPEHQQQPLAVSLRHSERRRAGFRTVKTASSAQQEEATEQVKESLAVVAKILFDTDSKVVKNNPFGIVEKQLNKSLKAVNDLLTGGKDEI